MTLRDWTRATVVGTAKASLIFVPLLLLGVVVRGVATDRSALLTPGNLASIVGVCVLGSFVYAALKPARSTSLGYYVSWIVSGAVSAVAAFLLAYLLGMPLMDGFGGDELLVRDPMFWAFWAAAGGLTGFAYGRIARSLTSP